MMTTNTVTVSTDIPQVSLACPYFVIASVIVESTQETAAKQISEGTRLLLDVYPTD